MDKGSVWPIYIPKKFVGKRGEIYIYKTIMEQCETIRWLNRTYHPAFKLCVCVCTMADQEDKGPKASWTAEGVRESGEKQWGHGK